MSANESIPQLGRLLQEVQELLAAPTKPNRRAAVLKLHSIAAIASTLALTVQARD